MAILFGSDIVHGIDVPSSSEGSGGDMAGPMKMLNHYPQFQTLGTIHVCP